VKKVTVTGVREVAVIDAPDPRPKENWVLVKVHIAPMCTEFKAYREGWKGEFLGHEAVGEVVEVAQPCGVKPGDRVVVMPQYPCGRCELCLSGEYIHCQHCPDFGAFTGSPEGKATMAQYLLKHDWLLIPTPEGVSYEHAGMACCGLAPTFGAFDLLKPCGMHTVLIAGLGPVGLGGVINATHRGARAIGCDPVKYRRELARKLGAEMVVDPTDPAALARVMEATHGRGVDEAIECAGAPEAQRFCIDATRRKGAIAFVGEAGELTVHVSNDLIRKGLTLHGSWHFNLASTPAMMRTIEQVGDKLDMLITHRFPMSQVKEAFELQLTAQSGKVLLYPWE